MKKILINTLLLFISVQLLGQDTTVNDANLPEAEFHVAINPTNPNNIVIASMHGYLDPNGHFVQIYYTNDFGDSWQISDYQGEPPNYRGAGDPVLGFDEDGNVFLVNLSITENTEQVHTLLSKSTDGGATWGLASTVVNFDSDKPWMAIDRYENSPNQGNIYIPVVENQIKLYSLDNTYNTTNISLIPGGDHLPSVVVKKNGDVFTSTVSFGLNNHIFVQKYVNGGIDLISSVDVVNFPDYTFNMPDISTRFQPAPSLAIDNSGGTYDGRLYMSYTASEDLSPDYFNVFLVYSDDDGLTWSTPKIVHSNTANEVQQFYSSLYVNNQGVLILDWYDRKNYNNSNRHTDFMMGISYDGSDTFTEIKLNSQYTDFTEIIESSFGFGIGEYHQCVATDDVAISFWSDGRANDGDLNIYMAKVNLETVAIEEYSTISNKIKISSVYPQPITDAINVSLELKETMDLNYRITDQNGQIVWPMTNVKFNSGKQTLNIPLDLVQGIYYLNFTTKRGYQKTVKFIKK